MQVWMLCSVTEAAVRAVRRAKEVSQIVETPEPMAIALASHQQCRPSINSVSVLDCLRTLGGALAAVLPQLLAVIILGQAAQ